MVERLNWACGPVVATGWLNSDESEYAGGGYPEHLGRIQDGLPFGYATFDYVVSHHGLMMLAEDELVPALRELRRVTKPGGWLRLSVPDLPTAIEAWACGSKQWFPLDAPDVDTALCRYITQGGATRSVFTEGRLQRLLNEAGWLDPTGVAHGISLAAQRGADYGITALDSRPDESIYMEARK